MTNPKIIFDNAVDRAATITASTTAPGLSVESMRNDECTDVHRATTTSLAIVMTWPIAEVIGSVHLPWCNLSSTAMIRVRGYSDEAGTVLSVDTQFVPACPATPARLRGQWTAQQAASAYQYGGGAHAAAWFANTAVKCLRVDLVDGGNLQGYIEVGRAVAGKWFSPAQGADYNPSLSVGRTGARFRSGSGRRRYRTGTIFKKMSLQLSHLDNEADRRTMWSLLLANGDIPFIFSLYPGDAYPDRERDHQMYCGLASDPSMRRPNFAEHAVQLDLESV